MFATKGPRFSSQAPNIRSLLQGADIVNKRGLFSVGDAQAEPSDSSGFKPTSHFQRASEKFGDKNEKFSIGFVLEKIVSRARQSGPPLYMWAEEESKELPIWKFVVEKKVPIEPKPHRSFCEWLNYAEMVSPTTKNRDSTLVVNKIIQMLNSNHAAQLDWIDIKLSFTDVLTVLNKVRSLKSAFMFYTWVRGRPYYAPDKLVYNALIDRLLTSIKSDTWEQVHVIVRDMINSGTAMDNKQFERMFEWIEVFKPTDTSTMQPFVECLLQIRPLGLNPLFSTYEKVMRICNKLGMYDSTISLFKSLPRKSDSWAFSLAFSACKCSCNIVLAEELLRDMIDSGTAMDNKQFESMLEWIEVVNAIDTSRMQPYVECLLQMRPLSSTYEKVMRIYNKLGMYESTISLFKSLPTKSDSWAFSLAFSACKCSCNIVLAEELLRDMIDSGTAMDNKQFESMLEWIEVVNAIDTSRMQPYVECLLQMRPLSSTYEKVMRIYNKLGMYDSTISLFKSLPTKSDSWAFSLAFAACKCSCNIVLTEELLQETKLHMELNSKRCNQFLTLYATLGHADKAKDLLEEMKISGVSIDLRHYTSVIHAYGKARRVKEAEDLFRSIEQTLDPGIIRAMAACYRNAGHFNELLALLREQDGSEVGATCFETAFEACVEKSEWKIALAIMKDMQDRGMSPMRRLYLSILLACSKENDYSACMVLEFNVREMDVLSLEDFERIMKMCVALKKVSCVLDALEVLKERGLGPPTPDLFEYCLLSFTKTNIADAMKMYEIMRCVGYVPSSSVLTALIQEQVSTEVMVQGKGLHSEATKLENLLASLILPSCKI